MKVCLVYVEWIGEFILGFDIIRSHLKQFSTAPSPLFLIVLQMVHGKLQVWSVTMRIRRRKSNDRANIFCRGVEEIKLLVAENHSTIDLIKYPSHH